MLKFQNLIAIILLANVVLLFSQSKQVISGKVYDSESQNPVVGAKITIILDSINKISGYTDKNGKFRVPNIPIGRRKLTVSSVGYQDVVINELLVTSGKEVTLNLAIIEKISKTDEIIVNANRKETKITTVNEYATVSARAFNIEETSKFAGALGDPSRMAANFAGVVGANDSRNDIVVRGNSPAGMLWNLEGINIPNPNHFSALGTTGGPVSMLNNNNLDKSDFFTGAFPAQYGNAFAGVFDLNMRNGNANKNEFIAQVGFNGFEFGAEGGLYGDLGASYILNYRYSTLGVFQQVGIDFGTGAATPDYQDLNFKVFLPINETSRFSVFGVGGASDIAFLGNDADTTQKNFYADETQNIKVDYQTYIAGITYENNLTENSLLKFTFGASRTSQNFTGDSIDLQRIAYPSGEAKFSTTKLSFVGNYRLKFDSKNSMVAGFNIDRLNFDLYNADIYNGINKVVRVDMADNSLLSQGFVQYKHKFTDEFSTIIGLHAQHYDLGDEIAIEPRASVQYQISPIQSISFGYGLHSQAQNIYDYFITRPNQQGIPINNTNMGFTRSHHFVATYDWSFADFWRVKIETYYQSLFNIPIDPLNPTFSMVNVGNSFEPLNRVGLINEGTATNYGFEFTLEKFFSDGFYMLATASIFDSKYKGFDKVERNTAYNTNYVANLLAGKEFKIGDDVFFISLKLTATGGRYLTPVDFERSKLAGEAVYDESKAFSERQTPYFRLDTKIGYRVNFGSSTMEFAIDFLNVTNNENVFNQRYSRRLNQVVTEFQQGFMPIPTFRYTF